jgi:hypothetical protein
MKIKNGFILRDVGGKTFVVAIGEMSKKFKGMITLNETGKFIWQFLSENRTEDEIVEAIMKEFEGAERTAIETDVKAFLVKLDSDGILE